jgi:SHS2 domain-containing protein
MIPYELLEHTADAKFRAYGSSKEEAFSNSVLALTALVVEPQKVSTEVSRNLSVKATSLQGLLFDFLDEILYLLDTEKFLPACAKNLSIVERDEHYVLDATLLGDDAKKFPGNLKAVTYSEMIVEETEDCWVIQVVIDI